VVVTDGVLGAVLRLYPMSAACGRVLTRGEVTDAQLWLLDRADPGPDPGPRRGRTGRPGTVHGPCTRRRPADCRRGTCRPYRGSCPGPFHGVATVWV
jgi:hypothetical protein